MATVDMVQILTTVDSSEAATKIAETVVGQRLAACAQIIGPIKSVYWWKGKMEQAEEWQCLLKTLASEYGHVEEAIRSVHPYNVPEIIALPVTDVYEAYAQWCVTEVSTGSKSGE